MNEIAIQTHLLSKKFGERNAVSDLSLSIKQGEVFSLLGTNGAGKTTTINMLCGLLKPTAGNATLMGYDISTEIDSVKKVIGVSPQETAIALHLNTYENLILMGGVFGFKSSQNKQKALQLMELMELENRKDQVRKLSGGMQRRLSIAMALMSDPKVLFLDEPTLGLDPHARKSVWNYIEKLKGEKTILLTTHYLEEADSLSDHIAIMDNSRIIEIGTSAELKKRYRSTQVLDIAFVENEQDVVSELRQLEYEAEKTQNGVCIKAPEIDFYAVSDVLRNNNVQIKSIEMKEPTLDEVFLQLTGKEAQS